MRGFQKTLGGFGTVFCLFFFFWLGFFEGLLQARRQRLWRMVQYLITHNAQIRTSNTDLVFIFWWKHHSDDDGLSCTGIVNINEMDEMVVLLTIIAQHYPERVRVLWSSEYLQNLGVRESKPVQGQIIFRFLTLLNFVG